MIGTPNAPLESAWTLANWQQWGYGQRRKAHVEETHKEMAYFQIDRLRDVIEGFEERVKETKKVLDQHEWNIERRVSEIRNLRSDLIRIGTSYQAEVDRLEHELAEAKTREAMNALRARRIAKTHPRMKQILLDQLTNG